MTRYVPAPPGRRENVAAGAVAAAAATLAGAVVFWFVRAFLVREEVAQGPPDGRAHGGRAGT